MTVLTGSINPAPEEEKNVKILVEGQKAETSPDDFGRFQLEVNGKPGDRIRLKVYQGKKLLRDDYYVLPGPAEITLDAPP